MQGCILKLNSAIKMNSNAEAARQTEMCMIYNEAWGNAKRGLPIVGGESVNEENLQSSFDVKA